MSVGLAGHFPRYYRTLREAQMTTFSSYPPIEHLHCPRNHNADDGLQWFRCANGVVICAICGDKIPQTPDQSTLSAPMRREIIEIAQNEARMINAQQAREYATEMRLWERHQALHGRRISIGDSLTDDEILAQVDKRFHRK